MHSPFLYEAHRELSPEILTYLSKCRIRFNDKSCRLPCREPAAFVILLVVIASSLLANKFDQQLVQPVMLLYKSTMSAKFEWYEL